MANPLPCFSLFAPPYREFLRLPDPGRWFYENPLPRGAALVWNMEAGWGEEFLELAEHRSPGMALMVLLPRTRTLEQGVDVFELLERCRPQTVLPHQSAPRPGEMVRLLSRSPEHLAAELIDYLVWRGVDLDQETRHLLRRTVELSEDLRTISALARGLYLSRRALGRRMRRQGLPVPSHWLQFARVLRAATRLQATSESLFDVAFSLGYPDGFTLSNQMERLTGARPSEIRQQVGWEWITEAWLQRERRDGRLRSPLLSADPKIHPAFRGQVAAESA